MFHLHAAPAVAAPPLLRHWPEVPVLHRSDQVKWYCSEHAVLG
ncbi:hypothetical protein J526_3778 [Acinetobacter baumannii 1284800]|nr:hypothetical protein J526_4206 [Acinetobacter baumannii 1284800]KCY08733.1 hypothetical protein J526_3778 [Acinetobacter baumannii 1284800]